MNKNISHVYSDAQNRDKPIGTVHVVNIIRQRVSVLRHKAIYVNVICEIDILSWRSSISVSLDLEWDMMKMSVNITVENILKENHRQSKYLKLRHCFALQIHCCYKNNFKKDTPRVVITKTPIFSCFMQLDVYHTHR